MNCLEVFHFLSSSSTCLIEEIDKISKPTISHYLLIQVIVWYFCIPLRDQYCPCKEKRNHGFVISIFENCPILFQKKQPLLGNHSVVLFIGYPALMN